MNPVEAVETIPGDGPILLTCEHASERMPPGYSWPAEDHRLIGTHWAYDLGAANLTRKLAKRLKAEAVLSRFSRLLIDPNRPEEGSDTLFRKDAEGAPVFLNVGISASERARRIRELHRPYHTAVATAAGREDLRFLLSIHSFTPLYEGEKRTLEVGVLFDLDEALASAFLMAFREDGLVTELNEPYSGKGGLMYCVDRHARTAGRPCIELEIRQDLLAEEGFVDRITEVIARFCERTFPR